MRSPKIFAMVQQFRKGRGKAKVEERRGHAGTVVTTAEIARMTKKTTAGQMVEHGKLRMAARQAKDAGKGWDAGKSNWISWCAGKVWQGKGVVSPKSGKAKTYIMTGAHQRKARAARRSAPKVAKTVDEAGDTDWWARSEG